jgi:Tfp pilus assembly protein PilN
VATYTDPTIIQLGEKPRLQLGVLLTLIAGIVALLGVVAFFVITSQVKAETTSINKASAAAERKLNDLNTVAVQLTELDAMANNLRNVFDNQKRWAVVLGTVEQRLYRNMVVTSMTFTEKGEMVFAGYTRDYVDYAKIYRSLTDKEGSAYFSVVRPGTISKVKGNTKTAGGTSTSTIPENYISFTFTLTLQPKVLNTTAVLGLTDLISSVNQSAK